MEALDHKIIYPNDDEVRGKAYYDNANRGWPQPKIEWGTLSYGTKQLWIARMKEKQKGEQK